MPVDRPVFDFYVETLKRLSPDAEWCGAGIGPNQIVLNEWCVASGGHARTGLEDNLRLDRDTLAPSNAALVRRIVELCEKYERPVATPAAGPRPARPRRRLTPMAVSPFDSALLGPLFGDPEAAAHFTDAAEVAAMVAVERALARAEGARRRHPARGRRRHRRRPRRLRPRALRPRRRHPLRRRPRPRPRRRPPQAARPRGRPVAPLGRHQPGHRRHRPRPPPPARPRPPRHPPRRPRRHPRRRRPPLARPAARRPHPQPGRRPDHLRPPRRPLAPAAADPPRRPRPPDPAPDPRPARRRRRRERRHRPPRPRRHHRPRA